MSKATKPQRDKIQKIFLDGYNETDEFKPKGNQKSYLLEDFTLILNDLTREEAAYIIKNKTKNGKTLINFVLSTMYVVELVCSFPDIHIFSAEITPEEVAALKPRTELSWIFTAQQEVENCKAYYNQYTPAERKRMTAEEKEAFLNNPLRPRLTAPDPNNIGKDTLLDLTHIYFYILLKAEAKQNGIEQIPKNLTPLHFDTISSAGISRTIKQILNSPTNIENAEVDKITHTMKIYSQSRNKRADKYEITIENYDNPKEPKYSFKRQISKGAKIFNFLMAEQYNQNKANISFPLEDLVGENAPYNSIDAARRGLKNILSHLKKILISGVFYIKGERTTKADWETSVVKEFVITNGIVYVELNNFFAENTYITILPNWSYSLNDRSYMLIDYFYNLGRLNSKHIGQDHSITIKIDAIRNYLCLPTPKSTKHHKEDIIMPIIEALKNIQETQNTKDKTDLKIEFIEPLNQNLNIDQFLHSDIEILAKSKFNITIDEFLKSKLKITFNDEAIDFFKAVGSRRKYISAPDPKDKKSLPKPEKS